jgi:hypothetical protein
MKKLLATALVVFSAYATGSGERLSKDEILRVAKAQAASFCHSALYREFTKVGCDFSATFYDNSWSVIATPNVVNGKGELVVVAGEDRIYKFSPTGQLLQQLDGE